MLYRQQGRRPVKVMVKVKFPAQLHRARLQLNLVYLLFI